MRRLLAGLFLAASVAMAGSAPAQTWTSTTDFGDASGRVVTTMRSADLGMAVFQDAPTEGASGVPTEVTVRLERAGTVLVVDHLIDATTGRLEIHSRTSTGAGQRLRQRDIASFATALQTVPAGTPEPILNLLNYLAAAPAGMVLDYARTNADFATTTLCGMNGQRMQASFTRGERVIRRTVTLGDCYDGDSCLGRCGAGCGGAPNAMIQRFTQECLNHDVCTGETGARLGPCRDEFGAATPGFFFAPDCGNISGTWDASAGWSADFLLAQSDRAVTGTVQTPAMCRYNVTADRRGASRVTMFLSLRPADRDLCCDRVRLRGEITGCSRIDFASAYLSEDCGPRVGDLGFLFRTGGGVATSDLRQPVDAATESAFDER